MASLKVTSYDHIFAQFNVKSLMVVP